MSNAVEKRTETKTIMEFLSENPDVDVSKAWERCWSIHSNIIDRVRARFPVERHHSTVDEDYFTSADKKMEGSFAAYNSQDIDWLVHSWIGNRRASLLDMNATVFLGQQTRVPHMAIIFGTIPKLFFYAEYTPRVDLRTNLDYLKQYYEPANEDFLDFRSDPNWTRYVSHGTYLRALMSPVAISATAELNDDNINTCEKFLSGFVDRWFGWLDVADEVPEEERAAQQEYDFTVRELGYREDPMHALTQTIFGVEESDRRLDMRCGMTQMADARGRWNTGSRSG
jgi:hypothetical protein